MIRSISGKLIGKSNNVFVRYDDGEEKVQKEVKVTGRRLYVQKCMRPEEIANTGILMAEKSRTDTETVLVLAVGDKVNTPLSKEERIKYKMYAETIGSGFNTPIEPMMNLQCTPNAYAKLIQRSPYDENEYFIDAVVPLFIIE